MVSISVIVPNLNYGRYLPTCLSSVLGQEGVDVRVIVIDNCSTDDSIEIVNRFAALDSRVELRTHEVNIGLIGSLSEGVKWAVERGADLTMTLSADDVLAPGAVKRASAVFSAVQTVGLVHGKAVMLPGDSRPGWSRQSSSGFEVEKGHIWIDRVCHMGRNPLFDPEVIVRTSLYAEIGEYNAGLPHTSDMEMWLRCAARMDVGHIRGAEQAFYRSHADQLSRGFWNGRLGDLKGRRQAFDDFFRQDGDLLDDADRLSRVALRALSLDAYRLANHAYDHGEAHRVPVDELVEFARECDPTSGKSLPAAGLAIRRRLGFRWSRPLLLLELRRIATSIRARLSWRLRQLRSLFMAEGWPRVPELPPYLPSNRE